MDADSGKDSNRLPRRTFLTRAALMGMALAAGACAFPAAAPSGATVGATTTPSPPSTPAFRQVELTAATCWGAKFAQAAEQAFAGCLRPEAGLSVRVQHIAAASFPATILTRLAGGDPFALIFLAAQDVASWVASGAALALNDLVAKDRASLLLADIGSKALGQWLYGNDSPPPPEACDTCAEARGEWTMAGRLYGLPSLQASLHSYFNLDLFHEAGLQAPAPTALWQWKQLQQWGRALTARQNGRTAQYGFAATGTQWCWEAWPNLNGAHIWDEALTRCLLDDPRAIEALAFYQSLIYVDSVALPPGAAEARASFAAGRVAILLDGSWQLGYLRDHSPLAGFDWDIGLPPVRAEGAAFFVPSFTAGALIPAAVRDVEASWAALQCQASQAFAVQLVAAGLAVIPVRQSALRTAPFRSSPAVSPAGQTASFYTRLAELGAPRRSTRYDLGKEIIADLDQLQMIYTNAAKPADLLPALAQKINRALTERPWNRTGEH